MQSYQRRNQEFVAFQQPQSPSEVTGSIDCKVEIVTTSSIHTTELTDIANTNFNLQVTITLKTLELLKKMQNLKYYYTDRCG